MGKGIRNARRRNCIRLADQDRGYPAEPADPLRAETATAASVIADAACLNDRHMCKLQPKLSGQPECARGPRPVNPIDRQHFKTPLIPCLQPIAVFWKTEARILKKGSSPPSTRLVSGLHNRSVHLIMNCGYARSARMFFIIM